MNKFKKITIMILIIAGIISGLSFGLQNSQKAKGAVSTEGLVLWLKMDDNLGTTNVIDSSVEGNHGTLSDVDGNPGATTAAHSEVSLHQRALTFDGTDDYVDCGSDSSLDITDAITIEAWVYKEVEGNTQMIVSRDDGTNRNYAIQIQASETLNFFKFTGDNVVGSNIVSTGTIPLNAWTHIVGTYISGSQKIYINGVEDGSGTDTGNIDNDDVNFTIGARENGADRLFNGSIDGVKIYNRALSAEEIALSYWLGSETRLRNAVIKNAVIK